MDKIDKGLIAAILPSLAASKLQPTNFPAYQAIKQIISSLNNIADQINSAVDKINTIP